RPAFPPQFFHIFSPAWLRTGGPSALVNGRASSAWQMPKFQGPTGRQKVGPAVRPGKGIGLKMSAEGAAQTLCRRFRCGVRDWLLSDWPVEAGGRPMRAPD